MNTFYIGFQGPQIKTHEELKMVVLTFFFWGTKWFYISPHLQFSLQDNFELGFRIEEQKREVLCDYSINFYLTYLWIHLGVNII